MSNENDDRDFADILAEFESGEGAVVRDKDPKAGEKVEGKVISLGEEAVFVDVGGKSDAMVQRAELEDEDGELTVEIGDPVQGVIAGHDSGSGCLILRVRAGAGGGSADHALALEELSQAQAHGLAVEGTVSEVIKGGVQVTVSGLRAFCPISQLDDSYIEDASTFLGQKLRFLVRKVAPGQRGRRPDIVVSRRSLLQAEKEQKREEALARISEGAVVDGTVSSVTSFGAFVDLGGVEGLIHVSELDHERVSDPATVVSPGDRVQVKVLAIEEREGEGKKGKETRISLSRRALQQDPWKTAAQRFKEGSVVPGRVARMESFGAFISLAPGLDGMAHISEITNERRIDHPRDVLELGQDVRVKILSVDTEKRRIGVSIAAVAKDATAAGEAAEIADYSERQKSSGGGFGALADALKKVKLD